MNSLGAILFGTAAMMAQGPAIEREFEPVLPRKKRGKSLAAACRKFQAAKGYKPTVINSCDCGRRISANKTECFACKQAALPTAA